MTGSIGRLAGVVNEILCEEFVTDKDFKKAVFSTVAVAVALGSSSKPDTQVMNRGAGPSVTANATE